MLNALHITTRKRLIQTLKSPNSICPKITNWQKGTSVCPALRDAWSLFRCIKSWNPEIPAIPHKVAIRLWLGRLGSPTGHDWSLSRKLLTISFHFPIETCNLMLSSSNCEISPCLPFGSFFCLETCRIRITNNKHHQAMPTGPIYNALKHSKKLGLMLLTRSFLPGQYACHFLFSHIYPQNYHDLGPSGKILKGSVAMSIGLQFQVGFLVAWGKAWRNSWYVSMKLPSTNKNAMAHGHRNVSK